MRTTSNIKIVLFISLFLLPLIAKTDCEMPSFDGIWTVVDRHKYPDSRLGSSISFKESGAKATFYTYDLGIKPPETKQSLQQLDKAIEELKYRAKQQQTDLTSPFEIDKKTYAHIDFIDTAVFLIASTSQMEFIAVGLVKGCFQKIRYTKQINSTEKRELVEGITDFAQFINAINFHFVEIGYLKY